MRPSQTGIPTISWVCHPDQAPHLRTLSPHLLNVMISELIFINMHSRCSKPECFLPYVLLKRDSEYYRYRSVCDPGGESLVPAEAQPPRLGRPWGRNTGADSRAFGNPLGQWWLICTARSLYPDGVRRPFLSLGIMHSLKSPNPWSHCDMRMAKLDKALASLTLARCFETNERLRDHLSKGKDVGSHGATWEGMDTVSGSLCQGLRSCKMSKTRPPHVHR